MSFIRGEASQKIKRYVETVISVIAIIWCGKFFYQYASSGQWVAGLVCLVILMFLLVWLKAAWQRARFFSKQNAIGVVEVDEQQISYFGPFGGSSVSINAITELSLRQHGHETKIWQVSSDDNAMMEIPVGAVGADTLFDAWNRLPNLNMERLLQVLEEPNEIAITLWRKR